jgi:hypothetical protein
MKKLVLCSLILFYATLLNAQPQWKFHIAFEDATGAKDTVFLIWDSTATFGMDTALGEIPMDFNTNTFQVYMYINSIPFDSSKVCAINTNYSIYQNIYAKNYVYPIKISWDTSLFHSSVLPKAVDCAEMGNDYFFLAGGINCQNFNMLQQDMVIAPDFFWGSRDHFPISIGIINDGLCCLSNIDEYDINKNKFLLFPNPVDNDLTLKCFDDVINTVNVYAIEGRRILFDQKNVNQTTEVHIPTDKLFPGVYVLEIILNSGVKNYERFIKR